MENLNRRLDGLIEQFGDIKEDLLDNRNKIAGLDKELSRRNSKLMKLESEVQESKAKCLEVEDELNNYKMKVVNLEEEIEKSTSKFAKVESELIESKGKVKILEQKLNEYDSRAESFEEAETDLASAVLPKNKIREVNRRLKVLEEKTDRLSSKAETEAKLKYVLNGLMLRAQKNFLSDKKNEKAEEESVNPPQGDVQEDLHDDTHQEVQHLASSPEENQTTSNAVAQPGCEIPLPEDSLNVAFSKCQELVRKRKIFLSEEELLTLSALEVIAGVKNGPAWHFAHCSLPDFQKPFTAKWVQIKWVENCNSTRAKCLYLKSCIDNFSSDSHFFIVEEGTIVLAMDDLRVVDREDDMITLVIERSQRYFHIFQSELEESKHILAIVQDFRVKSNNQNPGAVLESAGRKAKEMLKAEFIKYQERVRQRHVKLTEHDLKLLATYEIKSKIRNGAAWTIGQRNFEDFQKSRNETPETYLATMQAYVERCQQYDSDSQFFFVTWSYEQVCILEIMPDGMLHIDGWTLHAREANFRENRIEGKWCHDKYREPRMDPLRSKDLLEIFKVLTKYRQ